MPCVNHVPQVESLADAGHYPFLEQPQKFITALLGQLRTYLQPGSDLGGDAKLDSSTPANVTRDQGSRILKDVKWG